VRLEDYPSEFPEGLRRKSSGDALGLEIILHMPELSFGMSVLSSVEIEISEPKFRRV
jgi:hypothetical protein